jgi:hypothetical protein
MIIIIIIIIILIIIITHRPKHLRNAKMGILISVPYSLYLKFKH